MARSAACFVTLITLSVLFLPTQVLTVTKGIQDIRNYVAEVQLTITNTYFILNDIIVSVNGVNANVDEAVRLTWGNVTEQINSVQEILQLHNSWTLENMMCIDIARYSLEQGSFDTKTCVSVAAERLNTLPQSVMEAENRLMSILAYSSEDAIQKCSSSPPVTEEDLTSCLNDVMNNLRYLYYEDLAGEAVLRCISPQPVSAATLAQCLVDVLSQLRVMASEDLAAVANIVNTARDLQNNAFRCLEDRRTSALQEIGLIINELNNCILGK